jgi:tRNA nucleotidyltransferase/poly(A) polymerase
MQVAMDGMPDLLRSCPHFDRLLSLVTTTDAYLVGGAIRDILTGHPVIDIDLIFPHDPTALARDFARLIGGHWFWLDQERRQSRVVANSSGESLNYDFAVFRADSLEEDLLDRDFTINAMALPLSLPLSTLSLIDPCHGLADLRQNTLCMVRRAAFASDPLRIIKGVRHATVLDLEVEHQTLRSMQAEAAGLVRVARERIRQEIWKVLTDKRAARGLQLLIESGAGAQMFGDGFAGSYHSLLERLASCRDQWRQLAASHPVIDEWLARQIEQGLSNETLLIFTFLLAVVDKDLPVRLATEWKFSRKSRSIVAAAVALDAGVLNEFAAIARNQRAYAWWSARYQCEPGPLLLALAGSPGAATLTAVIREWVPLVAGLGRQRLKDLVDGQWLQSELCLEEGPEMTKALELLRNAEISGAVSSREEACRFLARHYHNRD